jgi:hypothetical protein
LPPCTSQSSGGPAEVRTLFTSLPGFFSHPQSRVPQIHLGNATQRDNKPGVVVAQPPTTPCICLRLRPVCHYPRPISKAVQVRSLLTSISTCPIAHLFPFSLAPPLKSCALRQESAGMVVWTRYAPRCFLFHFLSIASASCLAPSPCFPHPHRHADPSTAV